MTLSDRDALLSRLSGQDWPAGPLLEALHLGPSLDVLEVGAGDGRLLTALRERGHRGRVVGIDPVPGQGVREGRAQALPFPAAMFDVVLFVRVLAHLPDPGAARAEARRVLRPGGRLIAAAHGPDHLRGLWRLLGEQAYPPPTPRPATPRPAQTLDLYLPVTLDTKSAQALARNYGRSLDACANAFALADTPLADTLHLRVEFG